MGTLQCENGILYITGGVYQEADVDLTTFAPVSQISSFCFSNASNLDKIIILSSISSIGDSAFENCDNLSYLTFEENSKLRTIGSNAFQNNAVLTSVIFPSSLTTIGQSGFFNCAQLSSIVFPAGLAMSTIGFTVFGVASEATETSLLSIDLISTTITDIQDGAFRNRNVLANISWPNTLQSIGNEAFRNTILDSIVFPSSLTNIGSHAFTRTHLGSVVFPSSLTTIGPFGFSQCRFLSTIVFSPGCLITNLDNYMFANYDQEDGVSLSYSIDLSQTSITRIGTAAFLARNKMEAIRLPNTLSTIQNSAFAGTFTMTTITLPDSVTFLGSNIFSASLSSINVTSSFNHFALLNSTTIGQDTNAMSTIYTFGYNPNQALNGYSTYNIVTNPPSDPRFFEEICRSMPNPLFYPTFDLSGFVFNTTPIDLTNIPLQAIPYTNGGDIPIESLDLRKEVYKYLPLRDNDTVTLGSNSIYQGPKGVNVNGYDVSLPYTLSIDDTYLQIITELPLVLTNAMHIENGILFPLNGLQFTASEINLANLAISYNSTISHISSACFSNAPNLQSIVLISSISSIGSSAFAECVSLSNVTVANNSILQTIGDTAFSNTKLTTVFLPNTITSLGLGTFLGTGLSSITVTSSFSNFSAIDTAFIGVDTNTMSTIYTIGINSNPGLNGYSTYNLLLHPPTDPAQFQQITQSMPNPVFYPPFDLSSLVTNATSLDLTNVAVQAIPCVNGTVIPAESLDFRAGVYNYLPLTGGDTVTLGSTTLTHTDKGDFLVNGNLRSLPCTVQVGEQFLEVVAFGSAVLTNLMNIENGILYTTAGLSFTESSIDLTSLSLLYNSTISHISSLCFLDAPNLGGIHIVSSISSIGGSAFENCLQLSSLTFAPNSRLQTIGTAAFMTTHLGSVVFPSSLTTIEPSGFEECRFLSTIVFSPGCLITNLDNYMFANYDQEDGVSLSYSIDLSQTSITRIGTAAFLARNKMEAIRLPNTLSTIQNSAFAGTFTMTTITLPDSVTFLGSNIFSASLSSINVTSSFNHFALFTSTTIGQDTNAMSTIYTFGPNPNPGVHGYSTYNILLDPPTDGTQFQQITRSMTNPIQYPSFDLRSFVVNATSLDLSNVPVQAIPCVQGSIVPVESLDFRKGVYNYVPLLQGESITIGTTTLQQGTSGFLVNGVAKSLPCTVQAGEQFLEIVASGSAVLTNLMNIENGILYTTANLSFTEPSIDLTSLSLLYNSTISHISSSCFAGAPNLGGIHIVSSISSIAGNAFEDCVQLSSLTFAPNSRLQTIGSYAFSRTHLRSVVFPSFLTTIGSYAFYATHLGSVVFPSSLTTIGPSGFAQCTFLSTIVFSPGCLITNLDDFVFENSDHDDGVSLSYSIDLSQTSITRIGTAAFLARNKMEAIRLPNTLSTIQNSAFAGTFTMTTITLPDSVTFLGSNIFSASLSSINVTSSFNHFALLNSTTIGQDTNTMSTIYTFGYNPNQALNGYSTYNILLHPPVDQLKEITRSQTSNVTYPSINATSLMSYNPTSINLSNVAMNAIPCIQGSVIPDSFLNFNANVYNYLSMNIGESVILGGSTFTQISPSTFQINQLPVQQVPISYTIDGHDIELFAGGSGMFRNILPCLLEGTLVRTPIGFKAIETFKVGDTILSHCDRVKKVLKVGRWDCRFKDATLEQQMYKVPAGSYGATKDTFVSYFHKVGDGKMLRFPANLGLRRAAESEFVKDGLYTLYHLQVENGLSNHLIVNGNCLVDSWITK